MSSPATSHSAASNAPDEANMPTSSTTTTTTTQQQQQQQERLRNERSQREAAAADKAQGKISSNADDAGEVQVDDEDDVALRDMRDSDSEGETDATGGAGARGGTAYSSADAHDAGDGAAGETHPACAQCGRPVLQAKPPQTINGPLHPGCVWEYKFLHQPRCHYCDIRFRDHEATEFVKDPDTGALYHRACARLVAEKVPYERPTRSSYVRKLAVARSKFTRKNWKVRFFVLAPPADKAAGVGGCVGGIRYYVSDPSGKAPRPKNNSLTPASGDGAEATPRNSDNDDSNSNSSDDDDAASPDAAERRAKEEARLTKGYVRLDQRSRLITQPSLSLYRGSAAATPTHTELAIVFYDSADSKVERRLLFQCADAKERQLWLRALEAYIHIVDDPSDYKKKKPAASDKAVEQAAASATQTDD